MSSDSEVAIITVIEETPLNLSSVVEEAPLNLSDVCDSYLYKVSPEGLYVNNLFLRLEEL